MLELKVKPREIIGKAVDKLRQENLIPAIVYGHGFENRNVLAVYSDFERVYRQAGESSLVSLKIGDQEPFKVVINQIQLHPITGKFIHVDFYKVKMDEKIKTEVQLEFVGIAPAVKDLGGVLVKALDKIEIECLPGDLISKIEVDLLPLKTFDDVIRVADLQLGEKVEILTSGDTAIALVEEPSRVEEEPVEVIGDEQEKKEGEGDIKESENKEEESQEEK